MSTKSRRNFPRLVHYTLILIHITRCLSGQSISAQLQGGAGPRSFNTQIEAAPENQKKKPHQKQTTITEHDWANKEVQHRVKLWRWTRFRFSWNCRGLCRGCPNITEITMFFLYELFYHFAGDMYRTHLVYVVLQNYTYVLKEPHTHPSWTSLERLVA